MDFSKLDQNEKLAAGGAVAVIIGGLVGYSYGWTILAILAAFAVLAVIFLPQLSPGTNLPGSRGSLLLVTGGVAAVVLVLALLVYLSVIFTDFNFRDLFFLVAVVGGVVAAWAGWQEFRAEGGTFKLGTAATAPAADPAPQPSEPAPEPMVATEPAAPAGEDRTRGA